MTSGYKLQMENTQRAVVKRAAELPTMLRADPVTNYQALSMHHVGLKLK